MEEKERFLEKWKKAQQAPDALKRDYSIDGDNVILTMSPCETGVGFYAKCAFTIEGVQKAISLLSKKQFDSWIKLINE